MLKPLILRSFVLIHTIHPTPTGMHHVGLEIIGRQKEVFSLKPARGVSMTHVSTTD